MKKKAMNNKHHRSRTLTMSLFFFLLLQVLPYATAQRSNSSIPPPNPTFKPSMTVTIVVLAVACVIIAFFSFYIRRCARDIHMDGMGSVRLTRTRTRPAPRGLDPTLIETFPTFLYSVVKGLKIGKEVLECAVCLNEFEEDETLRLLPQCNHVFHPECIDAWLTSHTTCPVCRANLEAYSPSEATQVPGLLAEENRATPEVSESQTQVLIQVVDGEQNSDSKPDVINPTVLNSFPIQNRPVRSKSTRKGIAGKFPRSHSTGHSLVQPGSNYERYTGHSLVQPGSNYERYTLKLPDDVRKQIMNGKLTRTTSCVTFPRQGSVSGWSATRNGSIRSSRGRNNHQLGPFDRAGKSDRWGFSIAPPFFWRNNSSSRSKKGDASVSIKTDGVGQSSTTRPPV